MIKKFSFLAFLALALANPASGVQLVVTSTGAGTWNIPLGVRAGDTVSPEVWGAGSGASGATSFGAAGAGGGYSASTYTVTPDNLVNGVTYGVGAGTAGTSGSNPSAGGDSSFSPNNVNLVTNSVANGTVAGTPGTLPTGVSTSGCAGLTRQVVGFGTDTSGLRYFDVNFTGTSSGTSCFVLLDGTETAGVLQYTLSAYLSFSNGSLTNITETDLAYDCLTAGSGFLSTVGAFSIALTGTQTRFSATGTCPATTGLVHPYIDINYANPSAINITLRITSDQVEQAASASAWKSTPGYALGKGGGAASGTTGGTGGATATGVGTTKFAGGNGANFNAAGSGGGGAGGKDGAGNAGTTAGHGGQGDNTTGGAGGAVKAGTPGNPGTDNAEGAGGGGGITVSGIGGAGGAPGGGGGGGDAATGTGGTGGRGQLRLTWTPRYGFASLTGVGM